MKNRTRAIIFCLLLPVLGACFGIFDSDSDSGSNNVSITVTPASVTLARGETQQFTADPSYSITWSLEGATGSSSINNSGLLTIGSDETASTLTVRAKRSSYYNDGTAVVTIPTPGQTPSGLSVSKPGTESIQLSWSAMSETSQFTVQRSTNGTAFGTIATVSGTSYTDTAVAAGASYFYRISANGVNSQMVYAFAEDYFNMPTFAQRKLIPLAASAKHYYRFPVTSGQSYTIEWQNGNNQDAHSYIRVSAWQNNGTVIFTNQNYGFTNPRVFTATSTGFVTIEVTNTWSSSLDYQIYCYGTTGDADPGTVALPPYRVGAFRVSSPSQNSITLTWDSVSDASRYNIYRANTQAGTPGLVGFSTTTSFTDNQVPPGSSVWYTIAAVNADDREGSRFQGAFGIAAPHFALSTFSNAQLYALSPNVKHYYRLPVTAGQPVTITWQNGNNQDAHSYIRVSAWQNNGTVIFTNQNYGFTNPRVFTAASTGFVTIEITNTWSSSLDYQIYH